MINTILPHELHVLIEFNLNEACKTYDLRFASSIEQKIFYAMRAIKLMQLQQERNKE